MDNYFSPTLGVMRGQQVEQNMAQAQLEGLSLRERLALKKAAGTLGSQNYFAGYEGVPGAERPDYLKDAWQNADPEQAFKLESLVAEPFKIQRGIETTGKIEAAKKAADLQYGKNMMAAFYDSYGGQEASALGSNAFGSQMSPGSGVLLPGRTMSGPSKAPDATERTFEITPTGPKFGVKRMSPFEQSMKMGEDEARKAGTIQSRDTYNQNAYQNAVGNVRAAQQTLKEAQAAQFENPAASGQVALAHQELRARNQEFQALLRKMGQPQSAPAAPAALPPAQPASALVGELTGYDPQGELARVPPSAPSSGMVQPGQAPSVPPSPRTLSPTAPSVSPFGIPGAEKLSGRKQQEVGEKEVIVARDRARGQQVARSVIESLREQYTKLNDMGGITNTEKDAAGNIVAGSSSSSPGQFVGKLLGTKIQSLRNTIAQQRPLLMQSMMKASGMTAKQMDSNVELKLWLATATDPTLDFQTNMKALDTLEQLFSQGAGAAAPTPHAPFHEPDEERAYQDYKRKNRAEFLKTHKP